MQTLPPMTSCDELIARYEALLFDAYGVLVTDKEALPKARDLIDHLNTIDKPYFVVTNGSSSSPEQTSKKYQNFGLNISPERVITSGSLVAAWIRQAELESARFMILGPPSCHFMVDSNKGKIVSMDAEEFDVLIIGNQDGFPFRETIDHVISMIFRALDKGMSIPLLLPNPDLIFPGSNETYFMTGGMIAHIMEAALQVRYPHDSPSFIRLGKPFAPIFAEARRRAGTNSLVMIGDQMITDIKGALDAKIDAALISTGLSRIDDIYTYKSFKPTFRLRDLCVSF